MIGIGGFLYLDGRFASVAALAPMANAIPRCGTPSFAHAAEDGVALATAGWHAHLPVDAAHSLYRHAASGCIVVADARLQHRAELIRDLGLPGTDRTGDAELIAHAWLRHGEDCAQLLDGDFAFAIWDPRKRSLFCARDIMGVKPLYLHHAPGRLLAFSSRAEALLALPGVPADLDEGRIADTLVDPLEGIDKTCTFFKAIERLPPAHWALATPDRFHRRRYWSLQPDRGIALPRTDGEWSEAVAAAMERVIARHLEGDLAVGCMLSGGMDSSSLAVIARDQLAVAGRSPLRTFSSIDSAPGCQETAAIRAILPQPGFAPTLIDPGMIDALRNELRTNAEHAEEPFDATMFLPDAQYLMAARQGIHAVMDGNDADLLFNAGNMLQRQLRAMQWRAAWQNAKGQQRMYPAAKAWKAMALAVRGSLLPEQVRKALREPRRRIGADAMLRDSLLSPDFAQRVDARERLRIQAGWSSPSAHDEALARNARTLDHPFTTVGFERYHRVAARHGVDPRHPFADRELLELCVHLPDEQRMADGWTKIVLRRAMAGRLPDSVRWRTGKEHLGWGLIKRLVLNDRPRVLETLDAVRPHLAPYVDLKRLDVSVRLMDRQGQSRAQWKVFMAINLGNWLARHRDIQRTGSGPAHAQA